MRPIRSANFFSIMGAWDGRRKQALRRDFYPWLRTFLWILLISFGIIQSAVTVYAESRDLYDPHGKRDPFYPLVSHTSRQAASGLIGVESIDELSIQGIIIDEKNEPMVIINNSIMKQGEEQGAVKIIKIENDGVLVSVNGIEGFKTQYKSDGVK